MSVFLEAVTGAIQENYWHEWRAPLLNQNGVVIQPARREARPEAAAAAAILLCMVQAKQSIVEMSKDRGMFCTRWGVWLPSDGPYVEFFSAHNECPPGDHQRMLTETSVLDMLSRLAKEGP